MNWTELDSPFGELTVTGADNAKTGPGAVWDFTGVLPEGHLDPGQSSEAKAVVLQLKRNAKACN
jgi:hypothetical protein